MSTRMPTIRHTTLALLVSVSATSACQVLFGDFDITDNSSADAGVGGGGKANSSGGNTSGVTGGTLANGGHSSTSIVSGGASSTGGVATSVAGSSAVAGSATTGGVSPTGGSNASGGSSGATGGSKPTGGATAMGGALPTGGSKPTGGATATGGASATGGSKPTGGATATGGALPTGGTKPTGGAPPTGGARPTGGAPPTGGSTSTIVCGASGVGSNGICWYLGALGANCTATCASHGGPSANALSVVGIAAQGGSQNLCSQIVQLLAIAGTVAPVSSQFGIGCMLYHSTSAADLPDGPYWETATAYNVTDALPNGQRVCGCVQ